MVAVHFRLRIEDVGIAGIGRDFRRDVIDQTGIGTDRAFVARRVGAVGIALGFELHHIQAHHGLQPVGDVEMRRRIEAVQPVELVRRQIGARIGGLGDLLTRPQSKIDG